MKPLTVICFAFFLVGIGLFLAQLWFHVCGEEMFVKLMVTDGALFAVFCVWAFLIKENKQTDKINKGSSLD